jgi:putative ATP-dependent endonuclease of OLD family
MHNRKKINDLTAKSEENVLSESIRISAILNQTSLTNVFQTASKSIHKGTDWDTDFEKSLTNAINNSYKTEICLHHTANEN